MNKLLIKTENAEYQVIQSLKLSRVKRNKSREIFIEGIECIKQAVNANIEITRIMTKNISVLSNWGKSVIERHGDAKIIEMSDKLYNELSEKTDPSEMLITAKIKKNTLDDIHKENPFIILFDRPSDYGNLGSIIRSANSFNADGLFIMGHGADIYEPKVIRASMGSVFFTKIVTIESMEILTGYIKTQKMENNMEIIGTDSTGDISIKDCKIKRPVMVIIGNEAKGMSIGLKEISDRIIKIPIEGNVNSLNVSCAASIIMWEIYKNDEKCSF
ncbi:MAG: RNA methyltransferase [Treponema sp.]|jgi:TrmH family RNA methyltransferase|nr:RNA methyltransferase [Treponema sp.]